MSSEIQISSSVVEWMNWNLLHLLLKGPISPVVPELRLLKTKECISSCEWLTYNANLIPNIAKYLLLKQFSLRKLEWGYRGRPWWTWGHWVLKFWWVFFASGSSLSIPSRSSLSIPHLKGLTIHCQRKWSQSPWDNCHARQCWFFSDPPPPPTHPPTPPPAPHAYIPLCF